MENEPRLQQVNARVSKEAYERLRAWAFVEGQKPGTFLSGLVERVTEKVAEDNPTIDELVEVAAQYQAEKAVDSGTGR